MIPTPCAALCAGCVDDPGSRINEGVAGGRCNGHASALTEQGLRQDPYCGHLFVFRGRRGDLIKVIWWDGQGACLGSKRLDGGRFVWPSPAHGKVSVTAAQLAMLLEGIDWRMPQRTWRPLRAG